jgi:winged helix DNA-binding protein
VTAQSLSSRALNRALLARQLLLERSRLGLTEALQQVGGLQTQYAPSAYIGLWTRLHGFARGDLTRALEAREAVQATLMRSTIHVVAASDYWPMAAGIRRGRQAWWRRAVGRPGRDVDMDAVTDAARRELADGPMKAPELTERLSARGFSAVAGSGLQLWLDLVRVPPSGTWERRRADLYGLAEQWLGPDTATEEEGQELLVRRYLGAFGPAPARDVASWVGLNVTDLRAAFERIELVRYADEDGSDMLDLPGAPLPDESASAPVRFLPTWDANLLVHARRTLILPEAFRPLLFNTKTPHSMPSFTIDGQVAGSWRHESGEITISPFRSLGAAERRAVDEEAERVARFMAD